MAQLFQQEHREISAEEEVRALEEKLAEKKRELAQRETETPSDAHEKEMLREVLREHIEDVRRSTPHPVSPPDISSLPQMQPSVTPSSGDAADFERNEQLRALIETALSKSVATAVREAEALSPYLLDELHDHLVDQYYEKLVQLRKITP